MALRISYRRWGFWRGIVFGALVGISALSAPPTTQLTEAERAAVQQRQERFYADPTDVAVMHEPVPKFAADTGEPVDPNPYLKLSVSTDNPYLRLAQAKATPEFDRAYCRFLQTHFPGYRCGGLSGTWSSVEANDRVESLIYSWMDGATLALDKLPTSGQSELPLWSDDYWKTRYGQTSYRYAAKTSFSTYQEAIKSYQQPREWDGFLAYLDPGQLAGRVTYWSPAEKYDLSVGDEAFSLTNQQKKIGAKSAGADGNIETWMGLCHGWAAAAIMVPKPAKPATLVGARGVRVSWYPADVRALLTLAWGNGTAVSNFVGGRCRDTNPGSHPSGHIRSQQCFDTNPATFHLALGNLIGIAKKSFILDATYDHQVWNHPIQSYEFTYFRPGEPSVTSRKWQDVAVNYDAGFKKKDRFQNPLTRGVRLTSGWDDSSVRKVVGVTTTVVYLIEQQPPDHAERATEDKHTRVTYSYDLELAQENGAWVPRGGEWHQTAHPDFLWVPRRTTTLRTSFDYLDLAFNGGNAPNEEVADTARQASQWGYPLCQVLKQLVKQSSGADAYRCPEPLP